MKKSYEEIVGQFEKGVRKQYDYRHLPRTRCVAKFGGEERLEFILPSGEDPETFCRGWKKLSTSQIVFPQTQPELEGVLINFDVVPLVFVIPEPAPGG